MKELAKRKSLRFHYSPGMPLKNKIASSLHRVALTCGLSMSMARRQPVRRILMYHGVGGSDYSAETFCAGLEYLRAGFNILPLETIVEKILAGEPSSGNEIALTFDDGHRNNFTVVYPALQKFGVPATFFICPGLVDSGRWIWTQEVRERLIFLGDIERGRLGGELGFPKNSANDIVNRMKLFPQKKRIMVQETIRKHTDGFQPTTVQREKLDLMNWDEISRLDTALVTIGSHSATHSILSSLDPGEIEPEIAGSRVRLEDRLNRKVCLFCYPNGDYNQAVLDVVRQNYKAAVTTEFRAATGKEDLCLLPRISAAEDVPLLSWRLHRPGA